MEHLEQAITIGERNFVIGFEEVHNEITQETTYIIHWPGQEPFLMAYDDEIGRLAIQGKAPYAAREHEEMLDRGIDNYNNGFTYIH